MNWVLVLFLKINSAGGAVAVEMPTEIACNAALTRAKNMRSYEDGICLPR